MAKQVNFNGYLLRQFGAYIRTDLSALVQINGVASGIIGITGMAEKGPSNEAVTITSYTQLVNTFGDGPLVRHGLAAYIGGANTLVAVRLDDENSPFQASSAFYNVIVESTDGYTFSAKEPGTYGNGISVRVTTPVIGGEMVATSDTEFASASDAQYISLPIPSTVAAETSLSPGAYYVVESWNQDTGGYDPNTYSVYVWNGSRWSNADVGTIKTQVTTRLGSIEESLEVPWFINEVDWVRALSSTTSPAYYYVLKNIVTNQVREVPGIWLAAASLDGTLDYDEFERIVNDLKSEDEILFNGSAPVDFILTKNAPVKFPFELIKSIINYGGFGSGPSSFITLSDDDSLVSNPAMVSQGFTSLEGGYNSHDGTGWSSTVESEAGNFSGSPLSPTSAWDKALAVLENEDVNFVQPAYFFAQDSTFNSKYNFFKALASKLLLHVHLMSNTPNRKFRSTVLGLPSGQNSLTTHLDSDQFLKTTRDITGTINSDRAQLWAGGFYSTALESNRLPRLYGAEWLASFAVGAHAAREVSVSLTFSQMAGIFTGGLEYAWTSAQKDELYGRSLAFVLKRRTSTGATEFVAAHNYTSFTGAPNRGIQLFITRRIVDYMNTFIYKNLEENFIGRKSRGAATSVEIASFVTSLLRRLISEDTLVAFDELNVYADDDDKTVYYVEFRFQPVTEINFILTTNKLVYSLA